MKKTIKFAHYGCSPDTCAVDETKKTQTCSCQDPDRVSGRVTLREEWFENVKCECERLDGSDARPENNAFNPKSNECKEWSK